MITISLCMIVKNEERVLARCLDSIKDLVDEIIVVDTGSTDRTKEIAKNYTDRIFDFSWIDNFSAARNFSYSKATKDYILWLDADDVLLHEDRVKFIQLKETLNKSIDIVMMKYHAGFDEYGIPTLSYYRERLSKRSKNLRWHEPVHEYLETTGNIINSDIIITHMKEASSSPENRNLNIYEKSIRRGIDLSTRGLYYYALELYHNQRYEEAKDNFVKFLRAKEGWVEDQISACSALAHCYSILKDKTSMLKTLLKSFELDTPRAEICCQLGDYYFEKMDYDRAMVWYKIATNLQKPLDSWGFKYHDYWGYYPSIQLSLCYYYLGNLEKATYYNDRAGEYKPNDSTVSHNKDFFNNLDSAE